MNDLSFRISHEKVLEIQNQTGLNTEDLLKKCVLFAQKYARAEISNFKVGAALQGKSGAIYLGVNLEFQKIPLNQCVHAEQFAIAHARTEGEEAIQMMAISAPPCGHCRQFMNELAEANQLKILIGSNRAVSFLSLFPNAFGARDAGMEANLMKRFCASESAQENTLYSKALYAALNSYAPYSQSQSGIAIQVKDGTIYSGSYLENIGFNPSLSPLQVALVSLLSNYKEYGEIQEVLLIEKENCKISQYKATEDLLNIINSNVVLQIEYIL